MTRNWKTIMHVVIITGMVAFILLHAIASEIGLFIKDNHNTMPIIGGLSPSTTHDSTSTRNPALEDIVNLLSDLPGAYTFFISPIFVTPPSVASELISRQSLARISGVDVFYYQVAVNRAVFILVLLTMLLISSTAVVIKTSRKRRKLAEVTGR